MGQALLGIASWNELLAHVSLIAGIDERAHHAGEVDLLRVIELAAAGNAGHMNVPDPLGVAADAADDVAVHDGDVVDIEQQLGVLGIDAPDDLGAVIDVVALVAGMAFHGMRIVASVEVLEYHVDMAWRGVGGDLAETLDGVGRSLFSGDFAARWIVCVE